MLDPIVKPFLDPILEKIATPLSKMGFGPTSLSVIGFAFALSGCFTIAMQNYIAGLVLILIGRVIDAGAVRTPAASDFTDYLRITLEWIFYAAFVFFFALSATNHYMAASFLLFTYVMIAVTILSYKVIAAKRGQIDDESALALLHPARLVERSEILIFIALCSLMPGLFSALALLFGFLTLVTAGGWIFKARQNF